MLFLAALPVMAFAQTPCESGFADSYPCQNLDLWSFIPKEDLGNPSGMNDIWGWTDPETGREFALVCHRSGMAFVEVSNPAAPIFIGSLPSYIEGSNTWRDCKVFEHYVFVVSEFGDHGMQVFDLNHLLDPADPLPITFTEDAHYDGFGKAHNIAINEETGFAYAVGTNTASGGLHVVNINDPLNPVIAGTFGEDGYTHDVQVVTYNGPDTQFGGKEIALACNADHVAIIDVTDKTDMQLISSLEYSETGYTHQGWLTEDHRYFLANDELDELNIGVNTTTHIFDLTFLEFGSHIGSYVASTSSIDHNHYVKDTLCYQSNYRAGLRVLDVTGVANAALEEIAYFDTQPDTDAPGFTGTWSNYPYFPSGTIVVNDITTGLFVLKLNVTVFGGCMDEDACNYDPEANQDNGTCEYALTYYDCDGLCLNDADGDGVCDELEVSGCDDPAACNFNEEATDNDGSCVFLGPGTFALSPYDEWSTDEDNPTGAWFEDVQTLTYDFGFGDEFLWQLLPAGAGEILSGEDSPEITFQWDFSSNAWNETALPVEIAVMEIFGETCSQVVTLYFEQGVGITEVRSLNARIYPNPASENIRVEMGLEGIAHFRIMDAAGRLVKQGQLPGNQQLDVRELSEGSYTLQLELDGSMSTLPLIIQR